MQTLIVFNGGETGDRPELFLVDGDKSHLNDLCLDGGTEPEYYEGDPNRAELARLLFGEDGTGKNPLAQKVKQGPILADHIVTCVFVP